MVSVSSYLIPVLLMLLTASVKHWNQIKLGLLYTVSHSTIKIMERANCEQTGCNERVSHQLARSQTSSKGDDKNLRF